MWYIEGKHVSQDRQKGLRLLEQGALRLDIPDRHRAVADELTKLEKEDFFWGADL